MKPIYLAFFLSFLYACGSGDESTATDSPSDQDSSDNISQPTPEPTGTPTPAPTPIPTPTPLPDAQVVPPIDAFEVVTVVGDSLQYFSSLNNGDTVDLAALPDRINITAVSSNAEGTGSVAFELSGPENISQIDNDSAYTLQSQSIGFDVTAKHPSVGDYTLRATPYSEPDGLGTAGTALSINFTVIDTAQVPSITGINLVRVDASDNLSEEHTIQPEETIDLNDFAGTILDFSAVSSDPDTTGSVMLSIDTSTPISLTDDSPPYLLGGGSHFNVDAGELAAGTYTLTATPYSEANGEGDVGETYRVSFTIVTTEPDASGTEWLLYNGQYVAITNDLDNCLDRDYDNHKSIFCGGDDLDDMNSSVNPSEPEICGDGFDNNQDGLTDYDDSVNCQHAAAPNIYHVDTATGDDTTGDGSAGSPFATIAKVNTVVASGDTVLLHEGYYGDVQLAITDNPYDTVDALEDRPPLYTDWVTYKAAPGAEHLARLGRLEIGNRVIPSGYHDKYPKDSEYAISGPLNPTLRDFRIRIEGLTIEDGVSIQHGRFVHIKNNVVKRVGPITSATDCSVYFNNTGIEIGGRYILIEDNEVTHTAHGIHGGAHDAIIRNNRIHHITHDGMGLILGRNYLIEGNQIYNTDDGYFDNDGSSCNIHSDGFQPYIITYEAGANMGYDIRNVSFKRNLIYHTESMIIMLQSSPYADYSNWMSDIKLRNFLFENNIFGPSGGFMLNIIADGFDGFIFRNNSLLRIEGDTYVSDQGRTLLCDSFSVRLTGPASVKSAIYNNIIPEFIGLSDTLDFAGYNYYDTQFLSWYDDLAWYRDWVGDLFREGSEAPYVTSDFSGSLLEYSPLINTGTRIDENGIPLDLPITEDFYGNPRDNRPDRGAVEVTGLNPDHQLTP